MTTIGDIRKQNDRKLAQGYSTPIYYIMLFEHPDKQVIGNTGRPLGWPDLGATDWPGFYYSLEDAIDALECNAADMRETIYNAGFVLVHYPGMYNNAAGSRERLYFLWDESRQGYYQTEEPDIFQHIAF